MRLLSVVAELVEGVLGVVGQDVFSGDGVLAGLDLNGVVAAYHGDELLGTPAGGLFQVARAANTMARWAWLDSLRCW